MKRHLLGLPLIALGMPKSNPGRGLAPLYGTPREFPEYAPGYYAVFFEDPDRIKLEVVHVPPRSP